MTRTERASYPRAIVKDRSEPKNAMDKRIPKNGAGPHNWGSLEDEPELEAQAEYDEEQELQEDGPPCCIDADLFPQSRQMTSPRRATVSVARALSLSPKETERKRGK
ncbi:hypothetical protein K474DRAFT_1665608 [Panus rudis PR-1116 ss-1]|nr:hypothetical protein K474DRAFT_1665608 [Panus rudis PR-1116 ss-1]